jgi:hypothetical protein
VFTTGKMSAENNSGVINCSRLKSMNRPSLYGSARSNRESAQVNLIRMGDGSSLGDLADQLLLIPSSLRPHFVNKMQIFWGNHSTQNAIAQALRRTACAKPGVQRKPVLSSLGWFISSASSALHKNISGGLEVDDDPVLRTSAISGYDKPLPQDVHPVMMGQSGKVHSSQQKGAYGEGGLQITPCKAGILQRSELEMKEIKRRFNLIRDILNSLIPESNYIRALNEDVKGIFSSDIFSDDTAIDRSMIENLVIEVDSIIVMIKHYIKISKEIYKLVAIADDSNRDLQEIANNGESVLKNLNESCANFFKNLQNLDYNNKSSKPSAKIKEIYELESTIVRHMKNELKSLANSISPKKSFDRILRIMVKSDAIDEEKIRKKILNPYHRNESNQNFNSTIDLESIASKNISAYDLDYMKLISDHNIYTCKHSESDLGWDNYYYLQQDENRSPITDGCIIFSKKTRNDLKNFEYIKNQRFVIYVNILYEHYLGFLDTFLKFITVIQKKFPDEIVLLSVNYGLISCSSFDPASIKISVSSEAGLDYFRKFLLSYNSKHPSYFGSNVASMSKPFGKGMSYFSIPGIGLGKDSPHGRAITVRAYLMSVAQKNMNKYIIVNGLKNLSIDYKMEILRQCVNDIFRQYGINPDNPSEIYQPIIPKSLPDQSELLDHYMGCKYSSKSVADASQMSLANYSKHSYKSLITHKLAIPSGESSHENNPLLNKYSPIPEIKAAEEIRNSQDDDPESLSKHSNQIEIAKPISDSAKIDDESIPSESIHADPKSSYELLKLPQNLKGSKPELLHDNKNPFFKIYGQALINNSAPSDILGEDVKESLHESQISSDKAENIELSDEEVKIGKSIAACHQPPMQQTVSVMMPPVSAMPHMARSADSYDHLMQLPLPLQKKDFQIIIQELDSLGLKRYMSLSILRSELSTYSTPLFFRDLNEFKIGRLELLGPLLFETLIDIMVGKKIYLKKKQDNRVEMAEKLLMPLRYSPFEIIEMAIKYNSCENSVDLNRILNFFKTLARLLKSEYIYYSKNLGHNIADISSPSKYKKSPARNNALERDYGKMQMVMTTESNVEYNTPRKEVPEWIEWING